MRLARAIAACLGFLHGRICHSPSSLHGTCATPWPRRQAYLSIKRDEAMPQREAAERASMQSLEALRRANQDFLATEQARNSATAEQLRLQREVEAVMRRAEEAGASITRSEAERLARAALDADGARSGSRGGSGRSGRASGGAGRGTADDGEFDKLMDQTRQRIAALEAEDAARRMLDIQEQTKRGADALEDIFGAVLQGSDNARQAVIRLLAEIPRIRIMLALFALPGFGSVASGLGNILTPPTIPGFANGGHHGGGLRVVGERDPEIEATGPARYWTADQTKRMLSGYKLGGGGGGAGGGTTRVKVDLSPDLIGKVVENSREQTVEIAHTAHADVLRDIRVMLDQLGEVASSFAGNYVAANGKANPCFHLPKDLTLTLVSGYNVVLRKRIIDRWLELEGQGRPAAIDVRDPGQLALIASQLIEVTQEQAKQTEAMQGTVQAHERLSEAGGSFCISDAAKTLGIAPGTMFDWLRNHRWIFKRDGSKEWTAYADRLAAGMMERRVITGTRPDGSEWIGTQARITAKGLSALAKLIVPTAKLIGGPRNERCPDETRNSPTPSAWGARQAGPVCRMDRRPALSCRSGGRGVRQRRHLHGQLPPLSQR
ncbi:phage regulatory protein/antirepressor Ant, partial [Paracoccus bogoriensis]|uniref:phage antirepressor KilAC domain-containing protein n=1 Tax=Paracoccus bogoriensis TaxID=242065 RepID=UPI001C6798A5